MHMSGSWSWLLDGALVGVVSGNTDKVLSMWSGLLHSVVIDAKGGLSHRAKVSFPRLCPVEISYRGQHIFKGREFQRKVSKNL